VVVLQLQGAKRWLLAPPPHGAAPPLAGEPQARAPPLRAGRGGAAEATLRPGDLLYMPRGWAHAAAALAAGGRRAEGTSGAAPHADECSSNSGGDPGCGDEGAAGVVPAPSLHVTLGLEVAPAASWWGFAHALVGVAAAAAAAPADSREAGQGGAAAQLQPPPPPPPPAALAAAALLLQLQAARLACGGGPAGAALRRACPLAAAPGVRGPLLRAFVAALQGPSGGDGNNATGESSVASGAPPAPASPGGGRGEATDGCGSGDVGDGCGPWGDAAVDCLVGLLLQPLSGPPGGGGGGCGSVGATDAASVAEAAASADVRRACAQLLAQPAAAAGPVRGPAAAAPQEGDGSDCGGGGHPLLRLVAVAAAPAVGLGLGDPATGARALVLAGGGAPNAAAADVAAALAALSRALGAPRVRRSAAGDFESTSAARLGARAALRRACLALAPPR
jgi:hypothetical protein